MGIREMWRRLTFLLSGDRETADLEDEMRLHVELRERRLMEDGLTHPAAAVQARRGFGDRTRLVERSRDEWGTAAFDSIVHDVRYAARSVRSSAALSAGVVLTLGIVIGASTAVFGLAHSLFLQRLPLPEAHELVSVQALNGGRQQLHSEAEIATLASGSGAPQLAGYRFDPVTLEGPAVIEDVWADLVSGNHFEVLRAQPIAGRVIDTGDTGVGGAVAVVSAGVAERNFGSAAGAVGATMRVNGVPVTVIGVMPRSYAGLHFARQFTVALPAVAAAELGIVRPHGKYLFARIPEGDRHPARAALEAAYISCCVDSEVPRSGPEEAGAAPNARPGTEGPTAASGVQSTRRTPHVVLADASRGATWGTDYRAAYRNVLAVVAVGVTLLLALACANIATLLLARAVTREREFAVRASLGAGRSRLTRQLLAESLLLAFAGGALGLLGAFAGTTLLIRNMPAAARPVAEALAWMPSAAVVAFTFACVLACTLLCGLLPARHAARADLMTPLKGRARARSGWMPAGRGLVVTQIALALVLVCSAGLFVTTLRNLLSLSIAAASPQILLVDVEAGRDAAVPTEVVLARARAVPGIADAAFVFDGPLRPDNMTVRRVAVHGSPLENRVGDAPPRYNAVTAGYFRTSGIGLVSGRDFTPQDAAGAEPVAILSQALATALFPAGDAVGAVVISDDYRGGDYKGAQVEIRVVGVAHDAPYDDPRSPSPFIWYGPLEQAQTGRRSASSLSLLVRTNGDVVDASSLRSAIEAAASGIRVRRITRLSSILDEALARERFAAALTALFGAIAFVLAITGVYGLLSHTTARRTHEIGVRMALGATAGGTLRMVLRQTLVLAAIGVCIGGALTVALMRAARSHLFGVGAADPFILLGGAFVMIATAVLASVIPAVRAARIPPGGALRAD